MKTFTAVLFALVGTAFASPAALDTRSDACGDLLYGNAQCCSVDVLGVADLDCATPDSAKSAMDLKSSCSKVARSAKCCTLPVAGQAILCKDP